MVSTRMSTTTRKAPLPKEETKRTDDVEEEPATDMDVTEPQPPISEGDESPEEEPKASPKKKEKASKNSSKKKAEAKTRNKGIGLNIPNGDEQEDSAPRANKKIVFSDDFEADDEGDNAIEEPSDDDDDDDSDGEDGDNDDAVEEVGTSDAKNQALNQLAMEREVAQENKLRHRKKKRKAKELPIRDEKLQEKESDESDVDDIDEDFLAAVDSELATSKKEMKALKKQETLQKKFAGKHTTFVSDGNLGSKPIPAEHNIELVLLGSEDNGIHSGSSLGTKPSEAAKLFSRGRLEMDFGQENGKSKKERERKGKHPSSTQDEGWTRSKKMKFIGHGTQMRHMTGRARGRAAVQFITKQKN